VSSTAVIKADVPGPVGPGPCLVSETPRKLKARERAHRNVLIIGSGESGRELAEYFHQHPLAGFMVRGFLDDSRPAGADVLGRVADLARIARAEFVDEIILTAPCERELAWRVVREARRNRLSVKAIPDLIGLDPKSVVLDRLGDLPVLKLHQEQVPVAQLFLKRMADIVLAGAGLVAIAPMLASIALAIKLDSRGPVLYQAQRVGRRGHTFPCHKFRTMVIGADRAKAALRSSNQRKGPFFKIADDPRITRLGYWLRRYSLDELPQLWNVLRGEMSLVGPRPHPVDDFELYDLEHFRRLDVSPGITGLWQVTARGDPSFQRSMALDLEYIEHWSLGLDLQILCKTIFAVVEGSGT
jgi:exopolysaccharide biosynthesis polyprenyl glycosylphosphotransferase